MADETNTTETGNSTTETTSTEPTADVKATTEQSTTAETEETIDLGAAPEGDKGEAKAEDEPDNRTDDEKAADEAKAALFGAPEGDAGYELEGLPEGTVVDKEALEAVTPTFKELGLSNAGASKVASIYAEKVLPRVAEQFKTDLETKIVDQRTEWQGETLKAIKGEVELKTTTGDKIDFGGAGVKQVTQIAAKALDRVAPAGFREFLDETGLGQHPAMVAFAFKVGQMIAEDQDFQGGGGDAKPKSRTEKFYGR